MRCEKTATNFAAFVAFACGLILVKIRPQGRSRDL